MVERTVVERTVVERTVVERTVVETTSGGKHLSRDWRAVFGQGAVFIEPSRWSVKILKY